jgi:hypothetical protein
VVAGAEYRSSENRPRLVASEPRGLRGHECGRRVSRTGHRPTFDLIWRSDEAYSFADLIVPRPLPSMNGTASFFQALAPALIANVLTVVFVYCFAMISQQERRGEEGRQTYLWLIVMVFLFMLYGLYTWGVYPFKK